MNWEPVTIGHSGDIVSRGDGVYRKQAGAPSVDLRGEAERLIWLATQGIPVPEVLESSRSVLIIRAVPGRTVAEAWPEASRSRVVASLAQMTFDLHALPVEECPFDRRLAVAISEALVAEVDLSDLDESRQGWTRDELAAELHHGRPASEDLVVTHGDLCLPNVLLDPDTCEVTGVIDVGRLGVADRWTDLALATRSLAGGLNPQFGPRAAEAYLSTYGIELDPVKCDYYRLLDEFF